MEHSTQRCQFGGAGSAISCALSRWRGARKRTDAQSRGGVASAKKTLTMVSAHACRIIGTLMLIPLALAARGQAQPRQEGHTRVLTKVAEVRSLTATQASQPYPIHLKGVITYHSPEYLVTFFQDRTAGIFLFPSADSGIAVGDLVRESKWLDMQARPHRGCAMEAGTSPSRTMKTRISECLGWRRSSTRRANCLLTTGVELQFSNILTN